MSILDRDAEQPRSKQTSEQNLLSRLNPYLFALGTIIVGTVIRWLLMPLAHYQFSYTALFLSVVITAVLKEWRAGLFAMVLSFFVGNYFFVQPTGHLLPSTKAGIVGAGLYVFNCLVVLLLCNFLWQARRRAEEHERVARENYEVVKKEAEVIRAAEAEINALNTRLQRAMRETHHRIKNNLQVITALVDLQVMGHGDMIPVNELKRIGLHVRTLAQIHDILTHEARDESELNHISARAILDKLLPMLRATVAPRRLNFTFDDALLTVRSGASLALLVNELVSNAVKHGDGDIEMELSVNGDKARLSVYDEGQGFPENFNPETSGNTGIDLIESTGRWDLGGEVSYQNRPQGGASVTVIFPVSAA